MTAGIRRYRVRQERFPIFHGFRISMAFEPTIRDVCEIGASQRPKIRLDLPSI
jgi:hypothetical protein